MLQGRRSSVGGDGADRVGDGHRGPGAQRHRPGNPKSSGEHRGVFGEDASRSIELVEVVEGTRQVNKYSFGIGAPKFRGVEALSFAGWPGASLDSTSARLT